jgi:hypothetical protein
MDDYPYDADDEPVQPRDPILDKAITRLQQLFSNEPNRLFHSTQIETTFEREFFHWITGRALLELAQSGAIRKRTTEIGGKPVNFYASKKHRYWEREHKLKVALLQRVFHPDFAHALGRHGELMFDAALGRAGFRAEAQNTREWNGKVWTQSNHNLDRIYTRDGLAYGAEIKNTQNYISRNELRLKLQLSQHLEIIPLFIMRFAPKSYMHEIIQTGGFGLLFEDQMYPWGHSDLLREVRSNLGLKVASPRDVKEGDVQRLEKWHLRRSGRH